MTVKALEERLQKMREMGFIDDGTEVGVTAHPGGGYALGAADGFGGWAPVVPIADALPEGFALDEVWREVERNMQVEELAGVEA